MKVAVVGWNLRAAELCRLLLSLKEVEVHWVLSQHDPSITETAPLWNQVIIDPSDTPEQDSGPQESLVFVGRGSVRLRKRDWTDLGPEPLRRRLRATFRFNELAPDLWRESAPNPEWIQEPLGSDLARGHCRWVERSSELQRLLSELEELGLRWNSVARVLSISESSGVDLVLQAPETRLSVDRVFWCTHLTRPNFESSLQELRTSPVEVCWEPFGAWFSSSVLSPLPRVSYWVDPRHPEVFDTGELFDGSLHRVLCLPKGDQTWLQVETLHFMSDEDAFIRQKQRFSFLSTTLPFAALDRLERLSLSDESVIHPFFGFRLERHTKSFFELTGLGTPQQLRQKFQPWIRQVKVAGSKEYGATLR